MQFQFVLRQRGADVVLQRALFPDLAAHRGLEEARAAALVGFGAIKRGLGIGSQGIRISAVAGVDAGPDRKTALDLIAGDANRLVYDGAEMGAKRVRRRWLRDMGRDDDKFGGP